LWYQMALGGRRDLHLAPSPRAGFEMAVLRMLAFRPSGGAPAVPREAAPGNAEPAPAAAPVSAPAAPAAPAAPPPASAPVAQTQPVARPTVAEDTPPWPSTPVSAAA